MDWTASSSFGLIGEFRCAKWVLLMRTLALREVRVRLLAGHISTRDRSFSVMKQTFDPVDVKLRLSMQHVRDVPLSKRRSLDCHKSKSRLCRRAGMKSRCCVRLTVLFSP